MKNQKPIVKVIMGDCDNSVLAKLFCNHSMIKLICSIILALGSLALMIYGGACPKAYMIILGAALAIVFGVCAVISFQFTKEQYQFKKYCMWFVSQYLLWCETNPNEKMEFDEWKNLYADILARAYFGDKDDKEIDQ